MEPPQVGSQIASITLNNLCTTSAQWHSRHAFEAVHIVCPGEWCLYPEVVQQFWEKFSQVQLDIFADESTHC